MSNLPAVRWTLLEVWCAWCGRFIRFAPGGRFDQLGNKSHGICQTCCQSIEESLS